MQRTQIPVVQTLMGLGTFPETHPLALQASFSPTRLACKSALCAELHCWCCGQKLAQQGRNADTEPPVNAVISCSSPSVTSA